MCCKIHGKLNIPHSVYKNNFIEGISLTFRIHGSKCLAMLWQLIVAFLPATYFRRTPRSTKQKTFFQFLSPEIALELLSSSNSLWLSLSFYMSSYRKRYLKRIDVKTFCRTACFWLVSSWLESYVLWKLIIYIWNKLVIKKKNVRKCFRPNLIPWQYIYLAE